MDAQSNNLSGTQGNTGHTVCPTCGTCPTCGSKTYPYQWSYYPNWGGSGGFINTPNIPFQSVITTTGLATQGPSDAYQVSIDNYTKQMQAAGTSLNNK